MPVKQSNVVPGFLITLKHRSSIWMARIIQGYHPKALVEVRQPPGKAVIHKYVSNEAYQELAVSLFIWMGRIIYLSVHAVFFRKAIS